MKKNQKGFMLAELIITSTVVVTALVGFYASFNRIYSLYQTKFKYYHLDGVYASKEMVHHILGNDFNHFIVENMSNKNYVNIINDKKCINNDDYCNFILEQFNVNTMIFVSYDKCVLSPSSCSVTNTEGSIDQSKINETFKDYITYVIGYYNIEQENDYSYIVLTEIEENDGMYYSNLRIR